MKTTNQDQVNKSISLIVSRYRGEKSLREFADDISAKMPKTITYQTIKNWEDGIFKPSYYFMLAVAIHNEDWRRKMALEILAIMNDEMKPDTVRFDPFKECS